MASRRVTQSEIARIAGVHVSTVCLALQNHPGLRASTRRRIVEVAERLGYSPDPMLSALAAYRNRLRPQAFRGQVTWLVPSATSPSWRKVPVSVEFHRGAAERAGQHGYELTDCDLRDEGLTPMRAGQVLRARGVQGILLGPVPDLRVDLEFPWEHFPVVAIGHSLARPAHHLVALDHFQSTRLLFAKLRGLGYRRIGMAVMKALDDAVGGFILGGYQRSQMEVPTRERLAAFLAVGKVPSKQEFERWLRRTHPEALITTNYFFPELLEQLGVRIPEDLGVTVLFRKIGGDRFAGIEQDAAGIGATAMDYLVAMIHRHDRGVPAIPQQILVAGRYVDGETVREVSTCTPAGICFRL